MEVSSANLSAIDLIEELQEDESIEDIGQMPSLCLAHIILHLFCRCGVGGELIALRD